LGKENGYSATKAQGREQKQQFTSAAGRTKTMPLQQQKQTIAWHEQNKNAAMTSTKTTKMPMWDNKNADVGQQKCQARRKQHCSINNYDANAAASTTTMPMPRHHQNHAAATKTTKTNPQKLGYSWSGRQLETINLREKKKYN